MTSVLASSNLNPWVGLLIAMFLILLNALFVAAEFALITARRTRIESLAENGDRRARSAVAAMQNLPMTLSGAQLGITVTSVGLGLIAEPAFADVIERIVEPIGDLPDSFIHGIAFGFALFVVVFLHMVLGEMVPKNLALAAPERTVLFVAAPHSAFVQLFRPAIWLFNGVASLLLKGFGIRQVDEIGTAHTPQEFVTMIDASKGEGLIDEFSYGLLSGALDLRARKASSIMIPWGQVTAVDSQASVAEISRVAAFSGHSRLLVVSRSEVLGFVHAKDLVFLDSDKQGSRLDRTLIRHMLVISEDRSVGDLLLSMRRSQIHFAVVRDKMTYLGIVTLEDILESIVGDITDETDRIRRSSVSKH